MAKKSKKDKKDLPDGKDLPGKKAKKQRDEAKSAAKAKGTRTVNEAKVVAAGEIAGSILASRKSGKSKKKAIAQAVETAVAAQEERDEALATLDAAINATPQELADLLRVGPDFDLSATDSSATPGFSGDKVQGEVALAAGVEALEELQERLFAAAKGGAKDSVLLIVQGMDTSGKGGIIRHVVGSFDPQGVQLTSFKVPTPEEKAKGFLWRIRQALPAPGKIGVFDRSQYEDVLVARVNELVTKQVWSRRYSSINTFEAQTTRKGIRIVKVMLHISRDEQKERLAERLDRADKHWKYRPGDLDDRLKWDDFQAAYGDALTRCSTENAPWYVVPADKKWYARWAVQQLVLAALQDIDPQWPQATFDVEAEKARLAEM